MCSLSPEKPEAKSDFKEYELASVLNNKGCFVGASFSSSILMFAGCSRLMNTVNESSLPSEDLLMLCEAALGDRASAAG